MTGFIPKEKLSAYERWEVAAFDEAEQAAANTALDVAPEPEAEPEPEPDPEPVIALQDEPPVIFPTAAEIEQMHVDAHQQGYDAGYEEGIAKARDAAAQIDTLMSNLQHALHELDQQVAEQLLSTSVEIAKQVIRQSLKIKPEWLIPVVKEAIATLHPHQGHPLLIAHPKDAVLIRSHLGEQLSHTNWKIIEDASITPGGCRVELGASEVDATLESRWQRVLESIGVSQEWLSDEG